ncbi:inositol phospholipid synthesis and fat-storage-inducing TM-domain-containing protein [Lineolata rhizophorae]|uniref:Acyl-coenzyme A diphosphatase SCS3 n=1 Tax=Lineolata rhizophorae TaxID=578093 RepID=A0A6A6NXC4_9PEZI|nr:inositol phospholipid synthesis and fat-storage-inducing TM-domain-containing protein [Lineolata rhizophorae]
MPSHPFLPTPLEAAILSIYPLTLLLGSLFGAFSSTTRGAPYDPAAQSFHPPELAPSYFARKRNVFNTYFVKVGWLWTTGALLAFAAAAAAAPRRARRGPRPGSRLAARYAAATALWYLVTQWCFGAPLIDRSFLLTGGKCEIPASAPSSAAAGAADGSVAVLSALECRLSGGVWRGGHDISGHVFLLVLGSALLAFEILPVALPSVRGLREERLVRWENGRVGVVGGESAEDNRDETDRERSEERRPEDTSQGGLGLGTKVALGVAALMGWMLLMTAIYFHTWVEKLTGLLVAFMGIWLVYFLPRGVPAVRFVLGMPAV